MNAERWRIATGIFHAALEHPPDRRPSFPVYLADRADETFHQHIAIKIVRPAFADAEITGRFRQEREVLAALDHPTIALSSMAAARKKACPIS